MVLRQIVIERPFLYGKHGPTRVQVDVDDRSAIGPWITTLAARLGYPLVDSFGSPLPYRLCSVSGDQMLPTAGRFADAHFPSGSHFVLEPERPKTRQRQCDEERRVNQTPRGVLHLSRRSLISVLAAFSLLGLGSGMTTAFAQCLLSHSKRGT